MVHDTLGIISKIRNTDREHLSIQTVLNMKVKTEYTI